MLPTEAVTASYDVVTPLMLGGANHAPEFRLASFVGVLRWWWRFLALGRFGDCEKTTAFWDAALFGWSAKPFGRKRVSFGLDFADPGFQWQGPNAPGDWQAWSGLNYLTAQGFKDDGRGGRRRQDTCAFAVTAHVQTAFDVGTFRAFADRQPKETAAFTAQRIENAQKEYEIAKATLVDAMALIGLVGGLGARARRGFGSLAIRTLQSASENLVPANRRIGSLPSDVLQYRAYVARHLGEGRVARLPPYTALSTLSTFEICASGADVAMLMNEIGWAFQIYRSWGQRIPDGHRHVFRRNDTGRSIPAGRAKADRGGWYDADFRADHDGFYANGRGPRFGGNHTDNRAILGLPHNYGGTTVGWAKDDRDGSSGRRASPLLFHFHRLAGGAAVFLCLTAPATFVPHIKPSGVAPPHWAKLHVSQGTPYRDFPAAMNWDLLKRFAGFVRTPPKGAGGGANNGVAYSTYKPETVSI